MRCNLGVVPLNQRPVISDIQLRVEPVVRLPRTDKRSAASRVRFSPSGNLIATANHDGTLSIYDTETALKTSEVEVHSAGINDLCFSGGKNHLFTASVDGTAACLDLRCPSQAVGKVTHSEEDPSSSVTAVAIPLTTSQYLLTGGFNEIVSQWDIRTFGRLNDVRAAEGFITSMEFLGDIDDSVVIVTDVTGATSLYDAEQLEPIKVIKREGAAAAPMAHAFSVNQGREILAIPVEGKPRLYDIIDFERSWNLIYSTENRLLDKDWCPPSPAITEALKPRTPTLTDPFVGDTAVEFLTANGPFVYGAALHNFAFIPRVMRTLGGQAPVAVDVYDTILGNWVGGISRTISGGSDISSVAVHPNHRCGVIAVTAAHPSCSTIIYALHNT